MPYPYYPYYQQATPSLTWVQGEAGAKSYLVAPNSTVMLMDSEKDVFYIKSTDSSGMPLPLRVFDYQERGKSPDRASFSAQPIDLSTYVTKDEFEAFSASIKEKIDNMRRKEGGKK